MSSLDCHEPAVDSVEDEEEQAKMDEKVDHALVVASQKFLRYYERWRQEGREKANHHVFIRGRKKYNLYQGHENQIVMQS